MTIPESTTTPVGTITVFTGTDAVVVPTLNPELPNHKRALDRMELLRQSLLARDPMMPVHLKEIHAQLIQEEELVHLLTTEQIAGIMAAQQVHTNVNLTQSGSTKAGKAKAIKATAGYKLEDL